MKKLMHPFGFLLLFALAAALPLGCSDDENGGEGGKGGEVEEPACQENIDCEPGLACIEGSCEACTSDGHCLREETCSPASNRCEFRAGWGNECTVHEHCPLGRYCVQGLCLATDLSTPCGNQGQCPEGMRCNHRVGNPPVCEEDLGCMDNDDCAEGEVCNPGTTRCEPGCTPENQAEVCQARELCVDGRCVECQGDEDCAAGLECDVDAGLCVGEGNCFTDRDCPAGEVCNPRISLCTPPPPPCHSDMECLPDERCDMKTGKCRLRACVPDQDDPNGSEEQAVVIGEGRRENLVVCENQEKWYRISLGEGDQISIRIEGDLLSIHGFEGQFRNAEGQVLQTSSHHINTTVNVAGDYFLRIRTRSERVAYALDVLVSKGKVCRNDTYEPNNEVQQATKVEGISVPGLVICPGDVDWFEVDVPAEKGIVVTLAQDEIGNLEMELYDGDGSTLLDSNEDTGMEKSVEAAQVQNGRAYIKVRASDARTENAYGLQISRP